MTREEFNRRPYRQPLMRHDNEYIYGVQTFSDITVDVDGSVTGLKHVDNVIINTKPICRITKGSGINRAASTVPLTGPIPTKKHTTSFWAKLSYVLFWNWVCAFSNAVSRKKVEILRYKLW